MKGIFNVLAMSLQSSVAICQLMSQTSYTIIGAAFTLIEQFLYMQSHNYSKVAS